MRFNRASGVLVHPTSFPTNYGIGDLGYSARTFLRFLHETKQSIWQILPLGPTGYGNSPYASYSAFAGNPYLISPDILVRKGLLTEDEARKAFIPSDTKVQYERAFSTKRKLFEIAFSRFDSKGNSALRSFEQKNKYWLKDFCLFMACLEAHGFQPWNTWEEGLAKREPKAIKKAEKQFAESIRFHKWLQFEFFNQWLALKDEANKAGIIIIGDIPIFVDHNSSDVWANPSFFEVDEKGNRLLVAGVPPDYFSATGQLWGNPLYRWKELKKDGYTWWLKRFEQMLIMTDAIRVDHFRGFDAYWQVKATETTAMNGKWVKGPGTDLFDTVYKHFGELPIIAEDLGMITKEVIALRDKYDLPGMKILQFGWNDNSGNGFLPHNFTTSNCVVYTGTHDNDTSRGWYESASPLEQHRLREYVRSACEKPALELIRLAMLSCADQAVFPLQDLMNLDTSHRMNYPGTTNNNWDWRYTPDMLEQVDRNFLLHLVNIGNRDPKLGLADANLIELEPEDAL
ncbi:MAG: 4-alpha-glucanotransferase [Balneolales bacterium]|nr:4-alpha-glucanotransferase [Balneolales bacterium]